MQGNRSALTQLPIAVCIIQQDTFSAHEIIKII